MSLAEPTSIPRRFDAGGVTLASVGERQLVEDLAEIARAQSAAALIVGPGDDAAIWRPDPGTDVVVSQDAMVEGRDFRRSWITPRQLGARALAVALSDIAGMGAAPAWCTATICAPASTFLEDVLEIHRGLCAHAAEMGCVVAGGDVSDIDGPLVLDVCVGGTVAPGRVLRRDAGMPGDALLVTGIMGRAAAGLRLLRDGADVKPVMIRRTWLDAQLCPRARIAEGKQLTALGVRCGGDISDGLIVDADRTAASSGCAAEIWLDAVPVDPELAAAFPERWVDLALGGGEDFELLIATGPESVPELLAGWLAGLAELRLIGRLVAGSGVKLLEREGGPGRDLPSIASRHYR